MKRQGATLIEVLVAIFVMALGMMALLTLFPLGALRMAQAIQDDRAALCAGNADAIATIKNIRNDSGVVYDVPKTPNDIFAIELFPGLRAPSPLGPSNVILVDPAGYSYGNPGTYQNWVAGTQGLIPRRNTSFTPLGSTEITRWFNFLDDIEFDRTFGVPTFPMTRDLIYSWAYLLQRPKTSEPAVVNMAVMVFKKRLLSASMREFLYTSCSFDTVRNVVTIDWAGEMPLRPGDWILDASTRITPDNKRDTHANFHRVVGVTEITDTQVEVEVQTPFRGFGLPGTYTYAVVVFDGLVEVFERQTGWK